MRHFTAKTCVMVASPSRGCMLRLCDACVGVLASATSCQFLRVLWTTGTCCGLLARGISMGVCPVSARRAWDAVILDGRRWTCVQLIYLPFRGRGLVALKQ